VVSSTPRPHFTPGKDPLPLLQEAGWVPGSVWTGGNSRPHRDMIPDRPARSQSIYRLSHLAHDQEGNKLIFLSELREFPSTPCLAEKKMMTACVSMLLKSRKSLICFRACFLPGLVKDLSAPRYLFAYWSVSIQSFP